MDDQALIKELNKILTLEHGHLGMYLEQDDEKRNQFIAEIAAVNMLEAELMHLWLEDKLKKMSKQVD